MTTKFLVCAAFLLPWAVSADTLILRNGTQLRGTFNSANANQIGFTDSYGNRQNVNRSDVQELRFGNDSQGQTDGRDSNNTGFGRANGNGGFSNRDGVNRDGVNAPGNLPSPAGTIGMADDLDRLLQDLQAAMDNNNLSDSQRQTLEDSRSTLRNAAQQSRNGRQVNQRNVRLALDSVRNAAERMQRQDRDALNDDIRRLGAAVNGTGRDY